MRYLVHAPAMTQDEAVNAILNACRGNPFRADTKNVIFEEVLPGMGSYTAILKDADGQTIAIASIDALDG